MRVLVADSLAPAALRALEALGLEVVCRPELGPDTLVPAIGGAHVLVVRSTEVPRAVLEAGDRLQVVIRAGAGTNTIDCRAAAELGIFVTNCPGKNAIAVAELAMGLILSLDRRIPDNVAALRAGRWETARFSSARGLHGRTLGIVGLGTIGVEVARRARAFGMRVVGWSRSLDAERAEVLEIRPMESVRALCALSDVVSVHVAYAPETHYLLGADELAAMRPGTLLVDTSRGGVVDSEALRAEVSAGRIRAAADVYEKEPSAGRADWMPPLATLDGFYGTHHIGASTDQAQEAIAAEVVRIVRTWLRTGEVPNAVNLAAETEARAVMIVRHLDRVGVLAAVLDVLKRAGFSVQQMENTVFQGAVAANAKIALDRVPDAAVAAAVREASPDILGVEVVLL